MFKHIPIAEMRCDRRGLARTQLSVQVDYGQRHAESADAFQDPGAGLPLINNRFCQQQWWAPVKNCCRCHSPGAGFEARSQPTI